MIGQNRRSGYAAAIQCAEGGGSIRDARAGRRVSSLLIVQSLKTGFAWAGFDLASIQNLACDLPYGHAAATLREVRGVTEVEEGFAMVIANAFHPVFSSCVEGALFSNPLGAEAAYAIETHTISVAAISALRS
jgi:hypothetical protein